MAASFPTSIKSYTALVAGDDVPFDLAQNWQDEIVAIETALLTGQGLILTAGVPGAFVAATHNWAATAAAVQHISATGAVDLTGIVATADYQIHILINVGAFTITIKHDNAGSTATNRFFMTSAADIALPSNAVRTFLKSGVNSRWRPIIDG